MMDYKEGMECANSWFNGGSKLSMKQKERLLSIWHDEERLKQDTNYICWYFMFPPRAWALEIAEPLIRGLKIDYKVWFLKNNRKEFIEWFDRLQNRLDNYRNKIPYEWERISGSYNVDDSFNAELNSEEIERWYNIFINSSEYRFARGVYEFMVENFD